MWWAITALLLVLPANALGYQTRGGGLRLQLQQQQQQQQLQFQQPLFAPAPAPAPSPSDSQMSNPTGQALGQVPLILRSSGSKVGAAVQHMLQVQGHLNSMRDNLANEYSRMKNEDKDLHGERDQLETKVNGLKADLVKQETLRAELTRLRKDLEAAIEEGKQLHERQKAANGDEQYHATLKQVISSLQKELEEGRASRSEALKKVRDQAVEAMRDQVDLQNRTQQLTDLMQQTEAERKQQHAAFLAEKEKLLQKANETNSQLTDIKKELHLQSEVLKEQRRLQARAQEVARERQALEAQRADCSHDIQEGNARVAAIARAFRKDTEELRRCQAMDADNQRIQAEINQCRAATLQR